MSEQKCRCDTDSDLPNLYHQVGCPVLGTLFHITDDIKMLRETLCSAQSAINHSVFDASKREYRTQVLERLIKECDRHRPIGLNGQHANLHTDTCGCAGKGARELWGTVTPIVHGQIMESNDMWCGMVVDDKRHIAETWDNITCESCKSEILRNC